MAYATYTLNLVAQELCIDGSFTKARHSREGGNLAVGSVFRQKPE